MIEHYEWCHDGMETVGEWGTYVHSKDYDELSMEKHELQKKYDALVDKIGELYQLA